MSAGSLLFVVCTIACIVGAVATVAARNPIRGAVGLLTTIMGIAGLFLGLDAQFLAAIQLIVYAGAVVVLFVFVIMLLGPDAGAGDEEEMDSTGRIARGFSLFVAAGMLVASAALLFAASEAPTPFKAVPADHGSVEAVGALLFTKGLVPFELATVLLIVAVVGAIAVARGKPSGKKPGRIESPTRRMFHGPVVPRSGSHAPAAASHSAESLGKEAAQ